MSRVSSSLACAVSSKQRTTIDNMNVIIFINKHHIQKKGFSSWEAFLLSYIIYNVYSMVYGCFLYSNCHYYSQIVCLCDRKNGYFHCLSQYGLCVATEWKEKQQLSLIEAVPYCNFANVKRKYKPKIH